VERRTKLKARERYRAVRDAQITRRLEVITRIGVYGGLLVPLVYAGIVTYPFVYLKMLYLQILVGLTFPAWVILAVRDPRYRPRATWLLWAIVAWFAALGVSAVFAVNSWRAFFGTQERMTGLFSLLHFLAWYVMATATLRSAKDWRRLLEFQLGVGFASAGAALLQLVFPGMIGTTEVVEGERISGLLGNPIFAAAYQAFNVFFVMFLWKDASLRRRCWYGLVLASAMASFLLAGSRGPLLGLVAGLGTAVLFLVLSSKNRRLALSTAIFVPVLLTSYALFVTFIAHRPSLDAFWLAHANLKHFFDFEIDIYRVRLWNVAWTGFLRRPILGWGPAGFEIAFDVVYRPEYHTLGISDEAHNRLLSAMCETGSVGTAAFLSVWAAHVLTVVRSRSRGALAPLQAAALIGAGVGHFVQNLFAFDTPSTQLMTFLLFATASAAASSTQPEVAATKPIRLTLGNWNPVGAVPALMFAVVLTGSVLPAIASMYTKRAAAALHRRDPDRMLMLLTRGERLMTPYREDQLLVISRGLVLLTQSKQFDTWPQRKVALNLAQGIADWHFARQKAHIRLRRAYAAMLLAIGKTYHSPKMLAMADALYRQNLVDCPRRQTYLLNYATFNLETGRLNEAEDLLRQAVALDPSIGEPRWELGKFLWNQRKRPDEGARLMAEACEGIDKFVPSRAFEWQQVAQVFSRTDNTEKLREVVTAVRDFSKTDRPTEVHLGIARYLEKSGMILERDQVLRFARERNPTVSSMVDPVLAGKTKLQPLLANNEIKSHQRSSTPTDPSNAMVTLARSP
jgi:tetratricopeptide (TPR) repeat protein